MTQKCPKCETINPADSKFCKECATPLPTGVGDQVSFTQTLVRTSDDLTRGMLFAGRYEIIEELGAGGMGKVYRAFDTKLEEEVALKFLKPEIAADRRTVERFRNEVKTVRKIRHKNVCAMYEFHEEGKTLYLTMEYVRGEDLKSLIHRTKALTVGASTAYARQIAEGLVEAHKLGIVHRDLKPGNIMIDKDGQAKIMDFGIARITQERGVTGEGAIIGTPEYMSPEQLDGKPADERADIYALGAILFEMATGRPPFEGMTPFSIANKHKSEPAPDPRTSNPQIPVELGRLILCCLEKDREKRFQTTAELLTGLEAVEAALPSTAAAAGRPISRTKPRTSREITVKLTPRKLIIPAAALIAIVVGVVFVWPPPWIAREGPPVFTSGRPSIAFLDLDNRTGQKDLDAQGAVLASMISEALRQSKYIHVIPSEQVNSILTRLGLLEATIYTRENLRAIGRRGLVKYLASGYFAKMGERYRVSLTVQEAESGKPAGTADAECTTSEKFWDLADELSLKIKPKLELTAFEVANDIDSPLRQVTTSSLEAYECYIKGREAASRGNARGAIELLEKAVAIDPEFAMAYRSLGAIYDIVGQRAELRKNLNRALELANRLDNLTLREKLNIQGFAGRDPKSRFEAYSRLIELYPEDPQGNGSFGLWYSNREEFEKAAERYEVLVKNKDSNFVPYLNLGAVYCTMGEYAKAEDVLKRYIREFQGLAATHSQALFNMHSQLAGVYAAEAKYELALAEAEKALRLDPSRENGIIGIRGQIFQLQGKFDRAEEEFRKLLSDSDVGLQLNTLENRLVWLYVAQGKFEKAKEIVKQGIETAAKANQPQRVESLKWTLFWVHYPAGEIEAAEAILAELWKQAEAQGRNPGGDQEYVATRAEILNKKKAFKDALADCAVWSSIFEKFENKKMMRFPLCLQGRIESEMGNQEKAIELLSRAKSMLRPGQGIVPGQPRGEISHVFVIDPLALAYFRAGDLERARQEYESITRMTSGRFYDGYLYAKSFYMLGQIYEKMGKKGQARTNYRRFLDLWKDADPGLPEVEDARKRLAGL